MSLKSMAAKLFARYINKKTRKWAEHPHRTQQRVFDHLLRQAQNTDFGKDHGFADIKDYEQFAKQVPIRDYEALKPYIDRVVSGEENVLWPGRPLYFAKTSGTTSGAKYIPLTKASMPTHITAARNAILSYIHETGNSGFVDGKMIFLQGSPILKKTKGIQTGRLSGIVAHYVPGYLQKNRMPSWTTNCIDDWEEKVEAIVEETRAENMTVISGIPSWVQMYFEKLIEKTGKKVGGLFPNFTLFIYGGVNYAPYRKKFEDLMGRKVDSIELYPASEGFFAYQDSQNKKGMLLLLDSGIYYEFVKVEEFYDTNPRRLPLKRVETGVNYVMIISTTAGLWAYNLGDTVSFTSLSPYRVIVTGRVAHYISAFGEHVIGKEVEYALTSALSVSDAQVTEFTVAPQINPEDGLPYHEWFIEFEQLPTDRKIFAKALDEALQEQNSYYKDLITGRVLRPLKITAVPRAGFTAYMKQQGKLGGQNKLPRLSNDRKIAEALMESVAGGT